jgi:hypothetical protein
MIEIKNKEDLKNKLENYNIKYFYNLKTGENDNFIIKGVTNINHCVFTCNEINKHGDIYLPISPVVNDKLPFIPHIVKVETEFDCENIRKELNIPNNALVFGRYGGHDTFNITFVQETVVKVALQNPDIYLIFMNTPTFNVSDISNIIYVPRSANDFIKKRFILTCDAMIHARIEGESFGLSILEFAACKKPIITFNPSFAKITHDYHLQFLENNGYYYQDSLSLENIFVNFKRLLKSENVENVYNRIESELNPFVVMKKFEDNFLI